MRVQSRSMVVITVLGLFAVPVLAQEVGQGGEGAAQPAPHEHLLAIDARLENLHDQGQLKLGVAQSLRRIIWNARERLRDTRVADALHHAELFWKEAGHRVQLGQIGIKDGTILLADADAAISGLESLDTPPEFLTPNSPCAAPKSCWDLVLTVGPSNAGKGPAGTFETVREALEFAAAEMQAAGEAGRRFREFALGFNPLLAVPEEQPWIPYYGYGAGVVRLSLGDNSELGGRVTGGYVRWNFFADATVTVGNTVWVRDGKFVRDMFETFDLESTLPEDKLAGTRRIDRIDLDIVER